MMFFKGSITIIIFLVYIFTLWQALNLSLFSSFEWLKFRGRGKGSYGLEVFLPSLALTIVFFIGFTFRYLKNPIILWENANNLTEMWLRGPIYLIEQGQLGWLLSDIFLFLTPQIFALIAIFIAIGRIVFPKYIIRRYENQYRNIKRNKFAIKSSPAFELLVYSLLTISMPQMILALYRIWNGQFGYFPLNPFTIYGFTLFSILFFSILFMLLAASIFIFILHEIRAAPAPTVKLWLDAAKPSFGFNLPYIASWEDKNRPSNKELYTQTAPNKKLYFPLSYFIYCLIEGDPICALTSPKNAFIYYTQVLFAKFTMNTEVSQTVLGHTECKANPQKGKNIKYTKANVFYTMFTQNINKPLSIISVFYVTGLLIVCFMPYYLLIFFLLTLAASYLGILQSYSLVWIILASLPWIFIFYNSCEVYQASYEYIVLKNSGHNNFIKSEILNYIYAQESPRNSKNLWGKAYFKKENNILYKRDVFTADPPDFDSIKEIIENI